LRISVDFTIVPRGTLKSRAHSTAQQFSRTGA
jgi:hypothetical protein